jgi:hypothetical protein
MSYELYEWHARFSQEGPTYGLRLELLELLRPYVKLKSPFRISEAVETGETAEPNEWARIRDLVDWEIVLRASEVHDSLGAFKDDSRWNEILRELLPNLTSLLLEALDLMRQLEGADDLSDGSYSYQPSIAEHSQNQKFRDWTALIDLTRDAFLATAEVNVNKARAEVERWLSYPYPIFRRLAFYAATATDLFTAHVSLQWLLAHENWWLWSIETEREALRLTDKLVNALTAKDQSLLVAAILRGPPREMFVTDVEEEKFGRVADREIWLRLSKFQMPTVKALNGEAAKAFARISQIYPEWTPAPDQSDEFPVWMGEPNEWGKKLNSPKEVVALQEWLLVEPAEMNNDDWYERCRDDFLVAISALVNLSKEGKWPARRWHTALQVWSEQSAVLKSWQELRDVFRTADDKIIEEIARPLSWWLQAVGKVFTEGELQFHQLIRRVLASQIHEPFEEGNDPLFRAINHAVGQATDAVFQWWFRQGLEDDESLKDEPKGIFTLLCDQQVASYRYGRIILATHLIALFRVDRAWTEHNLLPKLDWKANSDEARTAWSGFLWAPRLYVPLLASIKLQFLKTVEHYNILAEVAGHYANLLTFVALEAPEPFTRKELALTTSRLPAEGLDRCATSLVQGLDSAGEKRAEYWHNRIRPYIKDIWPKSIDALSPSVANSFARLCMKAGDAFPDAVSVLKPWLSSVRHGDVTLHQFRETGLAKRFPEDALTFLDTILGARSVMLPDNLAACLTEIKQERPNLEHDLRYERLTRYTREVGG